MLLETEQHSARTVCCGWTTNTMTRLPYVLSPAPLLLRLALAATAALTLSGCNELTQFITRAEPKPVQPPEPQVAEQPVEEPKPIPEPQEKPKRGKLYEWSGDGRSVDHIVVNTNEQKARFYSGGEQIGWTTVASGVSKYPTPVGEFEVIEKVENKRSNLYGKIYGKGGKVLRSDAKSGRDPVPAGARFEGAKMPYFMRVTYDGIGLHAGPIPRPGRPASHGCIRMPSKMAPVLFKHVGVGTRVSIVGKGPDYGSYAKRQRALAAQRATREREQRAAEAKATPTTVAVAPAEPAAPAPADANPPSSASAVSVPVAPRSQVTSVVAPAPADAASPVANSTPVQNAMPTEPTSGGEPASVPTAAPIVSEPPEAPASEMPASAPSLPVVSEPPATPATEVPLSTPLAPTVSAEPATVQPPSPAPEATPAPSPAPPPPVSTPAAPAEPQQASSVETDQTDG